MWFVNEGAGHGEALAPAAREQAGAAFEVRLEMGEGDEFVAALPERFAGQAVEFAVELEVLGGGECMKVKMAIVRLPVGLHQAGV